MSKNDITGDNLRSKELSKEGRDNWDLIFPPKKRIQYIPPPLTDDDTPDIIDNEQEKHKGN